jgi:hypothetical protein
MQKRIRRYLNIKRCRWWYFKVRADTGFILGSKKELRKFCLYFLENHAYLDHSQN